MISFGITPFTDLPAHRVIRYFTRESSTKEDQVTVHSGLSHLWSDRRRHEEDQFATLMADLVMIAKELDLAVAGTISASDSVASMSGAYNSAQTFNANEDEEDEPLRGSNLMDTTTSTRTPVHTTISHTVACGPSADDDYYNYTEETQDAVWLNDMKAKVQTLLQDAHDVLGTPLPLVASTTASTESLYDFFSSDKHDDDDVDVVTDRIGHSLSLDDVISLYMRDHSNSNSNSNSTSFSSEGPTLVTLQDDPDSGHSVASKSDADWLLGDGDTSMDTANTSFSLDQYLEIESHLLLNDRGFDEKAIIHIPDLDSRNIAVQLADVPSLFSITSIA
ncbi:hypothetical protein APHAL10511_008069 [Amanita phalloides]|nr:hypothetical protein APHAL10511_008069 [Amanita phalloides]